MAKVTAVTPTPRMFPWLFGSLRLVPPVGTNETPLGFVVPRKEMNTSCPSVGVGFRLTVEAAPVVSTVKKVGKLSAPSRNPVPPAGTLVHGRASGAGKGWIKYQVDVLTLYLYATSCPG